MSTLIEVVDTIENKISRLLHKMDVLKQANLKLTQELSASEALREAHEKTIAGWEEKYNALKLANSMLGSTKNKAEAKLKIDTLIREIDQCIVQLSE